MKKNTSQSQFRGINTINISSPINTSNNNYNTSNNITSLTSPINGHKKLQGFDFTSTIKSTTFTNKI